MKHLFVAFVLLSSPAFAQEGGKLSLPSPFAPHYAVPVPFEVKADLPELTTITGWNSTAPKILESPYVGAPSGVFGYGPIGLRGQGSSVGVVGVSNFTLGKGGYFRSAGVGVEASSFGYAQYGIYAHCEGDQCSAISASAPASNGIGVAGYGAKYGLYGVGSTLGYAGWFSGRVQVTGSLTVDGTLSGPTVDQLWLTIASLQQQVSDLQRHKR